MTSCYDLIIVGAGIAGLRVGIETLKMRPFIRCCILEKYGYSGGRVVTFKKKLPKVGEVQWENGAGRISRDHKKVLHLIKTYKLGVFPISPDICFIDDRDKFPHVGQNRFDDLIKVYLEPLKRLSKDVLGRHTLKELLDKTMGSGAAAEFYKQFPYYSEIHVLRADLAIESFEKEMGSNEGFLVCKEGLSSLIDAMKTEFISRGGTILFDNELYRVTNNYDKTITLNCKIRNTIREISYCGKAVVLALHSEALRAIDKSQRLTVLKHLEMTPLLRMYAVFPVRKGVSWFSGLDKIVTNSPIRYIIPIDAVRGIVMISYTDGADAKYWIKQDESAGVHGEENVKDLVMTEIRRLFPDRTVPNPIFFKQHPWY
jgi:protoporphyrinogen oxidase